MNDAKWCGLASNVLKSELQRRDISYNKLIELLKQNGIHETKDSILSKMKRGTFKFSFFLQCASVIGLTTLHLDNLLTFEASQNINEQN